MTPSEKRLYFFGGGWSLKQLNPISAAEIANVNEKNIP